MLTRANALLVYDLILSVCLCSVRLSFYGIVFEPLNTASYCLRATRVHSADYDICRRKMSVCLSICLSVTRRCSVKVVTRILKRFHRRVATSQTILVIIARQHTDIAILSVRPSVRPSVRLSIRPFVRDVPVSDENGLTRCRSFFSPYGSPIILVLSASNIFTKFRRSHRYGGDKYTWGIKISRFSNNKSLYLADD